MIRGTTPTLEFWLPFSTDLIQKGYVTFAHGSRVVLEKDLSACICDGEKLTVQLTQKDTLALEHEKAVDIQIRVLTTNGEALASNIIRSGVGRILKDGEI